MTADLAVRPWLFGGPLDSIESVLAFVDERIELSLGSEAAATVLCDADVAALSKCAALALQSGFVVRSAYQNDRILSVTCVR
jgi:hypothetical protein